MGHPIAISLCLCRSPERAASVHQQSACCAVCPRNEGVRHTLPARPPCPQAARDKPGRTHNHLQWRCDWPQAVVRTHKMNLVMTRTANFVRLLFSWHMLNPVGTSCCPAAMQLLKLLAFVLCGPALLLALLPALCPSSLTFGGYSAAHTPP